MLTITIMITIGYHDNQLITTVAQFYPDTEVFLLKDKF